MAEFIDSDTKMRHEIADHMIDLCADLLDNPEIQAATNGLAKEARSLLDLLYIPNQRNGAYQVSGKQYEGYGIPLIVTTPYEQIKIKRLARYALHPLQQERLPGILDDHDIDTGRKGYEGVLERVIARYAYIEGSRFEAPEVDNSWIACVYSPNSDAWLKKNGTKSRSRYTVETSPVVFMQSNLPEIDDSGDLLFHELVHVQQALTKIIYRTKDMKRVHMRAELEAYSYEAIAQSIHYGHNLDENPVKWRAIDIENVRRQVNVNRADPFEINDALIAGIKKAGRWPL